MQGKNCFRRGDCGESLRSALRSALVLGFALLVGTTGFVAISASPASATGLPAVNTVPPFISGTLAVGQTLSTTFGTWSNDTGSFVYQWYSCTDSPSANPSADINCVAVGTNANFYTLVTGDVSHHIAVDVTATGTDGSTTTAYSNVVTVIVGTVSGTISYNGAGVGGVCIGFNQSDGGYGNGTKTASNGTYSIDLPPGTYGVNVDTICGGMSTSLYASQLNNNAVIVVANTTTTDNISLVLGGTVTGTISYNGTGVGGVCVSFNQNNQSNGGVGITTQTPSSGIFIENVPAGTFNVGINPSCSGSLSSPPSPYANQNLNNAVTVVDSTTTTENVALVLGGTVTGTISYDGISVEGACVNFGQDSGTGFGFSPSTSCLGSYSVPGLAPGTYTVHVDPTCYGVNTSPYAVENLPNAVTVVASTTTTENVTLALGGTVSGTISYNGTGVGGVCIKFNQSNGTGNGFTTTSSSGTYSVSSLPAGTYSVGVDPTCGGSTSPYGAQYMPNAVTVVASTTTTENVSLALGGTVSGTISFNGTGVGGVCVNFNQSNGTGNGFTTTPSSGIYSLILAPGTYNVSVDPTCGGSISSLYGAQYMPNAVMVVASTTTTEDVALSLGGTVSGTISYNGTGVGGVCVNFNQSNGTGNGFTTTSSSGIYSLILAPGTYNVNVDPTCGGSNSSPYAATFLNNAVTVVASTTTTEDVALALGGTVSGTISHNGAGVGGVCVNFNQSNGSGAGFATTSSNGTYSVSSLPAGTYNVNVDPTCGGSNSSPYASEFLNNTITITAGITTTENVTLAFGGSVSGTVSYSGTGVGGVCVSFWIGNQ